jgi:TPR repeat protein
MKAYQTGIGKFISLQREMKARGRVLVDCDAQGLERASAGGELAGGELYDPLPADLALVMQEVIDLYREGAEGGVAASEFDMGNMYMHGCGVEQNYELMMQWWR